MDIITAYKRKVVKDLTVGVSINKIHTRYLYKLLSRYWVVLNKYLLIIVYVERFYFSINLK